MSIPGTRDFHHGLLRETGGQRASRPVTVSIYGSAKVRTLLVDTVEMYCLPLT